MTLHKRFNLCTNHNSITYLSNPFHQSNSLYINHTTITNYIILNLVVAVIMEHFTWLYSMERTAIAGHIGISADDVRHFQAEWERLDPLGRGSIPITDLQLLLRRLREPLGRASPSMAWIEQVHHEISLLPGALRGRARYKELFMVVSALAQERGAPALKQDEQPGEGEVAVHLPAWEKGSFTFGALHRAAFWRDEAPPQNQLLVL